MISQFFCAKRSDFQPLQFRHRDDEIHYLIIIIISLIAQVDCGQAQRFQLRVWEEMENGQSQSLACNLQTFEAWQPVLQLIGDSFGVSFSHIKLEIAHIFIESCEPKDPVSIERNMQRRRLERFPRIQWLNIVVGAEAYVSPQRELLQRWTPLNEVRDTDVVSNSMKMPFEGFQSPEYRPQLSVHPISDENTKQRQSLEILVQISGEDVGEAHHVGVFNVTARFQLDFRAIAQHIHQNIPRGVDRIADGPLRIIAQRNLAQVWKDAATNYVAESIAQLAQADQRLKVQLLEYLDQAILVEAIERDLFVLCNILRFHFGVRLLPGVGRDDAHALPNSLVVTHGPIRAH